MIPCSCMPQAESDGAESNETPLSFCGKRAEDSLAAQPPAAEIQDFQWIRNERIAQIRRMFPPSEGMQGWVLRLDSSIRGSAASSFIIHPSSFPCLGAMP